jgi:hypothetical protein
MQRWGPERERVRRPLKGALPKREGKAVPNRPVQDQRPLHDLQPDRGEMTEI